MIGPVNGCYKIGKAKNAAARFYALRLPDDASIIHTIPSRKPFVIERILHTAFAHRAVSGVHASTVREWFRLDESEIAVVCSIPFADSKNDVPHSILAMMEVNGRPPKYVRSKIHKTSSTMPLNFCVDPELALAVRKFAESRGETLRAVIELALRRHMANPPPKLEFPPLPPVAVVEDRRKVN